MAALRDDDLLALDIGFILYMDDKDNIRSLYERSVKARSAEHPETRKILERMRQLGG